MGRAIADTCEQLHEDIDLLDATGWPRERIAHELSDEQIEEMIDVYLARGDDAVVGALADTLAVADERGHGPEASAG